jgi:hypothetical protein
MKTKIWINSLFLSIGLILIAKLLNANYKGLSRILSLGDPMQSEAVVTLPMRELLLWTKNSSFPVFVVPPADKDFDSFRFFSKKAVWGRVPDINQLAYSPDFYLKGMERLYSLGFSASGRHDFKFKYGLCYLAQREELNKLPIVIRVSDIDCIDEFNILFKNNEFFVVGKK